MEKRKEEKYQKLDPFEINPVKTEACSTVSSQGVLTPCEITQYIYLKNKTPFVNKLTIYRNKVRLHT